MEAVAAAAPLGGWRPADAAAYAAGVGETRGGEIGVAWGRGATAAGALLVVDDHMMIIYVG